MAKANVVRQRLIAAVARYARSTQRQVTVRQFCKAAKIEEGRVHEHFPRGIGELLAAAGLGHRVSRRVRIDFEGLMRALEEAEGVIGRVPTPGDMDRVGRVTARTYYDRMRNWDAVREEYAKWKKRKGEGGEPVVRGEGRMGLELKMGKRGALGDSGRRPSERPGVGGAGDQVPRPLSLPGMMFAPTCEAGVIYLFGLLARGLGYSVERMGTAFPDCVALRGVDGDECRRVRVEFEHRSSNFRQHGHDAARCDVIVCWEHDWKGCPVEVVELKGEVERVMGRAA